jgi:hypothetical protein
VAQGDNLPKNASSTTIPRPSKSSALSI